MSSDGLSLCSDSATDWIAKSGDKFQSKAQDFSVFRSSSKPAVRTIQRPFQMVLVFFPAQKEAETWNRQLRINYRLS